MDVIEINESLEDYALAEHRELSEARLQRGVTKVGRHAFYNCRNLKRLCLWDTLEEIGDGALKNCEKLSELVIVQSGEGSCAALKNILAELPGEFVVSFVTSWDSPNSRFFLRSRLYVPSYLHDYEENNEARIINQVTYGAGVHYRECIREAGIDYAAYDRLFSRCIPLDREAAWKVAFFRCVYPWELRNGAEKLYQDWLYQNRKQVIKELCGQKGEGGRESTFLQGENSLALLRLWLGLQLYQMEEDWKEAIDSLHEAGNLVAVGLLLKGLRDWRKSLEEEERGKERHKFEF